MAMQLTRIRATAVAVSLVFIACAGQAAAQEARHGALAIDRSNGFYYGFAHDHPSRAAAEAYADDECRKRGGSCSIVLSWAGTGCGAYRTVQGQAGTAYGWGLAATGAEADAIATREALQRSGGQPVPNHVWACNASDAGPLQALVNDAGPPASDGPLKFVDIDGDAYTYTGELLDGKPHGQGVAVWEDGSRYVGAFANGRLSGKGTKTWPSGSRYTGDWADDYQNGQGVNVFPSGARYEGEVRQAMMHGYGRFYDRDGNLTYEGRYADNKQVE